MYKEKVPWRKKATTHSVTTAHATGLYGMFCNTMALRIQQDN
jgi:hypothetical protein